MKNKNCDFFFIRIKCNGLPYSPIITTDYGRVYARTTKAVYYGYDDDDDDRRLRLRLPPPPPTCPWARPRRAARPRRCSPCPSRRCTRTWTRATWARRSVRSARARGTRSWGPAGRWTASTSRRRSRSPPSCRRGSDAPAPSGCWAASRARRAACDDGDTLLVIFIVNYYFVIIGYSGDSLSGETRQKFCCNFVRGELVTVTCCGRSGVGRRAHPIAFAM